MRKLLQTFQDAARVLVCLVFVSTFSPLIVAQSNTSDEAFTKGLKLYDAAQFDEAAKAFKRIIDRDHNNAEAYFYLGNAYFQMLRNKDALKAYERTVELKPDHYLAYNNLGTAHHRLGDFNRAVTAYKAALRIKPDYVEAVFGLGVAYLELKDTEAALEQHKALAAIDVKRADKLYAHITGQKIPLRILNGMALSLPLPSYPLIARAAHASGTVLVWVSINETGRVVSASAVSGHQLLRAAGVEAAKLARFTPTVFEGQAVRVTGIIAYNFLAQ